MGWRLLKKRGEIKAAVSQLQLANDVFGKPDLDHTIELAAALVQLDQFEEAEQQLVNLLQHPDMTEELRAVAMERCRELASEMPTKAADESRFEAAGVADIKHKTNRVSRSGHIRLPPGVVKPDL